MKVLGVCKHDHGVRNVSFWTKGITYESTISNEMRLTVLKCLDQIFWTVLSLWYSGLIIWITISD